VGPIADLDAVVQPVATDTENTTNLLENYRNVVICRKNENEVKKT
jgi:hypothetical protein